ncbi:hypothetical protein TWF788_001185 [Orbilia oligospora]|uniref:Uncharacterized protein n=1 Tax=Orbilia oligospora TaxID=2813651 RepID=A0A7C8KIH2_ORBOL|nr:hypothetical protein TWF788_001185 [Orbilia oligospora]
MSASNRRQTGIENFDRELHLERYGITRKRVPLAKIFPSTLPTDSEPDFKALVQHFDNLCKPYPNSKDPLPGDLQSYMTKIAKLGATVPIDATTTGQNQNQDTIEIQDQDQEYLAGFLYRIVNRAFAFLKGRQYLRSKRKESDIDKEMSFFVTTRKVDMIWTNPKGIVGACGYRATALGGIVGLTEARTGSAERRGILSPLKTSLQTHQTRTHQPATDAGCLIGQATYNLHRARNKGRNRQNRDSICMTVNKSSIYFSRAKVLAKDLRHYRQYIEPSETKKQIFYSRKFDFFDGKEGRKELLRGIMAVFGISRRNIRRILDDNEDNDGDDGGRQKRVKT